MFINKKRFVGIGVLFVCIGVGCWTDETPDAKKKSRESVQESKAKKNSNWTPKSGWTSLFDGKTTDGWEIKGPVEVKGGLLIVGGDQRASIRTKKTWDKNVTVTFEYSFEGKKKAILNRCWQEENGVVRCAGSHLMPTKSVKWRKTTARAEQKGNTRIWIVEFEGTALVFKWELTEKPIKIGFRVDPGDKLMLRHLEVKSE
ncbi:MAG: hypothetical protein KatS3mg105_0869 [Gemmatales bacterium]|nr:MAG: hypothetical protein KatS3mg105_0869 [Gemmatales bacterium]